MSRLEALIEHHPLPSWRPVAWPVMVLLGSLLAWANFAQLEEVAVATGEVIPAGQKKVIQHLEGGIIEQINFIEGDTVKKGDVLVRLNLASAGTNLEELQVRMDSQILLRARLKAEVEGKSEPVFPEDVARRLPDQYRAQKLSFLARKRKLNSNLNVLRRQVRQRELDVKEIETKGAATRKNLKLAQQRLKMSANLLKDGLTPKIDHLQLRAEVESLQGEMKSILPAVRRARSAVKEAKSRINDEINRFRSDAQDELIKAEQAIGRIKELLNKANEQEMRAEIRSPIDGVVQNLQYHTIGGVVKPGDPIMEIVPSGGKIMIEAKLDPVDRAYVREGMPVLVKLTAYDYSRYGGLEGRVLTIAPDSSTDDKGVPYFRVVVTTKKSYLGKVKGELPITPGMQALVDIRTGSRTVMEYLIRPVLKLKHEAFRER